MFLFEKKQLVSATPLFTTSACIRFQDVDAAGFLFFARVFDIFHDAWLIFLKQHHIWLDMRLIVMSATLDIPLVRRLLGDCPMFSCHIASRASIGEGTVLEAFVSVHGGVTIGRNCRIHEYTAVGGDPQDHGYRGEESWVRIGDDNVIRKNVTKLSVMTKRGWIVFL